MPNTGSARLDSLLLLLNEAGHAEERKGVGQLELDVHIKAASAATQRKRLCHLIPNLLPFEASPKTITSEFYCSVSFQAPCNLQITPVAQRYSNRKGRKLLREVYPVLLPTYAISQQGNDRYYVFPFTDDGLEEYTYTLTDLTDSLTGANYYKISFHPLRQHRVLMDGAITLDAALAPIELRARGRIDFGKFELQMQFRPFGDYYVPQNSHIAIDYNYAGNCGRNTYDCRYTFRLLTTRAQLSEANKRAKKYGGYDHHDLTSIYDRYGDSPAIRLPNEADTEAPTETAKETPTEAATETATKADTATQTTAVAALPPDAPTPAADTMQLAQKPNTNSRNLYQVLPERLMTASNINAFGTNLKVSGPLDPASLSYDKLNGLCFRERLRWSYRFTNGQSLLIRPEIGYSFGYREMRYRLTSEWIYWPERRCGLQLSSRNRNSGFSSRFIDLVNDALEDSIKTDFDDLGINYYHHYEARIEQSFELTNGLMGYVGIVHNYRTPVKHGARAISQEQLNALVHDVYSDFSPYVRIEWQPHQYYHYRNRQKLYIASNYPKFALEWAQGIDGILGSTGRYGRAELDVEQDIPLTPNRNLSYHVSTGFLYRQKGEYFVNYRYFASNQYPESWNDHIGGVFHLLSDHWYLSSPAYMQTHVMYESPFLLLHKLKRISRFSIKERIYLSTLLAQDKAFYQEMGYGMGNNYFNVGGFVGFVGAKFRGFGARITIEIDQHW
jgi:hypothetical protein